MQVVAFFETISAYVSDFIMSLSNRDTFTVDKNCCQLPPS